jgi:amino acid transporter
MRKLDSIASFAWVSLLLIVTALLLLVRSVASGQRPALAPQTGPIDLDVQLFQNPSVPAAAASVCNLFFAFTANIGYISYSSEMKRPQDLRKAVWVSHSAILVIFMVVGSVVYAEAGQYGVSIFRPLPVSFPHTETISR